MYLSSLHCFAPFCISPKVTVAPPLLYDIHGCNENETCQLVADEVGKAYAKLGARTNSRSSLIQPFVTDIFSLYGPLSLLSFALLRFFFSNLLHSKFHVKRAVGKIRRVRTDNFIPRLLEIIMPSPTKFVEEERQ